MMSSRAFFTPVSSPANPALKINTIGCEFAPVWIEIHGYVDPIVVMSECRRVGAINWAEGEEDYVVQFMVGSHSCDGYDAVPEERLIHQLKEIRPDVRMAVETNSRFRMVERADLTPGRDDILFVELDHYRDQSSRPWGTEIRLDDEPIRETTFGTYVFYACTRPAWDGQCFVPIGQFLGEGEHALDSRSRYWIPID